MIVKKLFPLGRRVFKPLGNANKIAVLVESWRK
jgi:hypothetical protein